MAGVHLADLIKITLVPNGEASTSFVTNTIYLTNAAQNITATDPEGATNTYYGKCTVKNFVAVEYNEQFAKKTIRIQLLPFSNTLNNLALSDQFHYAQVNVSKAIFDEDVSQQGRAVELFQGTVQNVIITYDTDDGAIILECVHDLYDFEVQNTLQSNSASYHDYLERTGYTDPRSDFSRMGLSSIDYVQWGPRDEV